jgi:hypothetical protein
MKPKITQHIFPVIALLLGLVVFTNSPIHGQEKPRLVEVSRKSVVRKDAPTKAVETFRSFFKYLSKAENNIGEDKDAQVRWLSSDMRLAMMEKAAFETRLEKENPTDKRDYPSNEDFVAAWDFPSTYSIIGSRLYGQRAVIDVEYEWGKDTNYEGDTRLMSFIFLEENGDWKLDDVYTFRGKFGEAESLSSYYRQR